MVGEVSDFYVFCGGLIIVRIVLKGGDGDL